MTTKDKLLKECLAALEYIFVHKRKYLYSTEGWLLQVLISQIKYVVNK